MPYFQELNILFIHIPKTGGTTIEHYFKNKLNIKLSKKYLFSLSDTINGHTYQHLTYNEIYNKKNELNVIFNDSLNIFSAVRNPYERLISELFYQAIINKDMNKNDVEEKIIDYINSPSTYDNHKIPQYLFLIDSSGNINKNIKIIRTESLNNDMKKNGFDDFKGESNRSFRNILNYYTYLTTNSIKLINNYYSKDFELFGYKKINTDINLEIYRELNGDLKKHLNNLDEYYTHYINNGYSENRPIRIIDKYPTFNVNYYKKNYKDLQNFNNNQLKIHYIRHGVNEKRICDRLC